MSSDNLRALVIEAPVGRHFAQLHRETASLVESVGLYVVTGLERGTGVVVIATSSHTEALLHYVVRQGIDAEALRRAGQFVVLDAEATLARILRGGMPVWNEFRRVIGAVIESAQVFGRTTTRAYGEIVSILWSRGEYRAAIQLEEYWNELGRLHPFSLFCSYVLDSHDHRCYHAPLADIGRTHSEILTGDDDEAFREALDKASRDVFGVPLSQTLTMSGHDQRPGEHRLPTGHRTMLWIARALPASSADVLRRARTYLNAVARPAS